MRDNVELPVASRFRVAGADVDSAANARCRCGAGIQAVLLLEEKGETSVSVSVADLNGDAVRKAVAIQIRQGHIARRPRRFAEGSTAPKAAFTVAPVDEFLIGPIVADDEIEPAVPIDVRDRCRISAVGRVTDIRRRKAGLPVVQQHAIVQQPVASLREDDIEMTSHPTTAVSCSRGTSTTKAA